MLRLRFPLYLVAATIGIAGAVLDACGTGAPRLPPADPCENPNLILIEAAPRPVLHSHGGLTMRICTPKACARCAWVTTAADAEANGIWTERICGDAYDNGPDDGELYCWAVDRLQVSAVRFHPEDG